MAYATIDELLRNHHGHTFRERAADLFAFARFVKTALPSGDHILDDKVCDALKLSDDGARAYKLVADQQKDFSHNRIFEVLLGSFYHHELFFDPLCSDLVSIRDFLSKQLLSKNLTFPWAYGNVLYRRAYKIFPYVRRTEKLSLQETDELLAETPFGVFQHRTFIAGPLGVLQSGQARALDAPRQLPLWHCDDPSCNAWHHGTLARRNHLVDTAVGHLDRELFNQSGPPSEWGRFLSQFDGSHDYYDDLAPHALPWLLGNALSPDEFELLAIRAFGRERAYLQEKLTGVLGEQFFKADATAIVDKLKLEARFQCVLLLKDDQIIEMLEDLISDDSIHIPLSEVRNSMYSYKTGNWFGASCELSAMGVRVTGHSSAIATARLKRLLKQLQESQKNAPSLSWSLRYSPGENLEERLDHYVNAESPLDILKTQVFAQEITLSKSFTELRIGRFKVPESEKEEAELTNKMIWKLGFDVPVFPLTYEHLFARLEHFRKVAVDASFESDSAIDDVRSAAVNFYVALEDFLDKTLVFSAWTLLTDHYKPDGFEFNLSNARVSLARSLREYQDKNKSGERIDFSERQENTLYPLIKGFSLLAGICRTLIADAVAFKRPEHEFPGFVGKSTLNNFPFHHTRLVLDISKHQQDRILALLDETAASLETSQLASLRNRVQHARDTFPTKTEILRALDTVDNLARKLEESGLAPLTYVLNRSETDSWGRTVRHYRNYKDTEIAVPVRFELTSSGMAISSFQHIFVPWISIADTAVPLSCAFSEASAYADLWREYPLRKPRTPTIVATGIPSTASVEEGLIEPSDN